MASAPSPAAAEAAPAQLVVVHPLVLLSVVDHYNRVARDTRKRVVGVLLGELHKGRLDVTNSYAVPFEEDDRDSGIWFLDHSYHEQMYRMFRRINGAAKEQVVGWYSTGPKIREADLDIHELVAGYAPNPVLVVIDVQPLELGLPTSAYRVVQEVSAEGSGKPRSVFSHLPSEVGAYEAEEIGVEHLLRDVKDASASTLATRIQAKLDALRSLEDRLNDIRAYLDHVVAGRLPLNNDINGHLQDCLTLLPNLGVGELVHAFSVKTNDAGLAMYVASLVRAVTSTHSLIANAEAVANRERAADLADAPATAPGPPQQPAGGG